jgi:transcriptional regulator with XRE-family HTH domain
MRGMKVAELLGRRIRALRKSKGLTQEQLGAACGVNYKFVGGIERGEENPSLSILQKISEGLGMEVIELFRFHHEESDADKLKKMITDIIKDEKSERLQLILKIISALR